MVTALRRRVDVLLEENEAHADLGCQLTQILKMDLTPEWLARGQEDWLRPELARTEMLLRRYSAWRQPRRERIEGRIQRKPDLRRDLDEHHQLLGARRQVLRQRRRILRQVGDALAWLVCGKEPRIISPFFESGRTQHLPDGIGAFGHISTRTRAHATGDYFVVENDLTRCLAVGDLTVVPVESAGTHRVYPVELKSHGKLEEGGEARIEYIIATDEQDERDREFLASFEAALGLQDAPETERSSGPTRQEEELVDRTTKVREDLGGIETRIQKPDLRHVNSVRQVLHRADIQGKGWDYPEAGLGYAAIRIGEGFDPISSLREAVSGLKRAGLGGEDEGELLVASSYELHRYDAASAHITPIALWPVSLRHRMMLLSEQIIFVAWHEADRWEQAFQRHGLDFRWEDGHWVIDLEEGEPLTLNPVEVSKATASVLFSGASPDDFASQTADALQGH